MPDQRRHQPRRPVVDRGDEQERQAETDGVGDQQERSLEDGAGGRGHRQDRTEDDPDARAPSDREDRAESERGEPAAARADDMAAESITEARPGAPAPEGRRARRGGQGSRGSGIEWSPAPLESRDVEEAREVQPEDDEDEATDRAQRRQVIGEGSGGEGRGDAEQREHGAEARHEREGMAHGQPARRSRAIGRAGDGDRGELAEICRHEREDARRQEADDAGHEGDEDRQVGAGHRVWSGVQDVGQQAPQLRGARRRARDAGRRARRPGSSRRTRVARLDRSRCRAPRSAASVVPPGRGCSRSASSSARASSHSPQPGRPYRTRSGRGASCISGAIVGEGRRWALTVLTGVRWPPRPRSSVDRARPS